VAVAQALVVVTSGGLGIGARLAGVVGAGGLMALAWRSRYPLAVLVATFATVFVQELIAPQSQSPILFLAILVAGYSLGAHAGNKALVAGIVLGAPGVAVGHALGPAVREFTNFSSDAFFFGVLVVAPAAVGRLVRAQVELAARLAAAGDRLSSLREQRVSGAVARERDRIVSELERVMLGGLDAMAAHAAAASLEQVTALETAARETLAAMRRLLAGLRTGAQERSPSRSLASLHERVALALAAEADPAVAIAGAGPAPARGTDATRRGHAAVVSARRLDLVLGVVAAVLSGAALIATLAAGSHHGPRVIDALLAAATVAPIAWARRATWPATVVAVTALFAHAAVATPSDPLSGITPTGLLLCFPLALGAQRTVRSAVAGLAVCLGTATLLTVADPRTSPDVYTELAATAAIIVGVWGAGRVLAARSRLLSSLADTALQIDREQRALADERLIAERNRVARELHDAFAHSMTVIVLQAGAARRVWSTNHELARDHVTTLRQTVHEVLGELRELILAVAHDPEHAPAALRIEGLVQRARTAGMEVELAESGRPPVIGAQNERAAYRIVQEALTNAARHAPGAAVRVHILHAHDSLSVMVENGPATGEPDPDGGTGRGLQGMRERAAACGGTVHTEPTPEGGFRIAASLPLAPS
jgi:signal transduction histidine kinase